jgi:UPF0271 protein
MTTELHSIDLNCDLGEGGQYDEAIMPLISSVNIASGGHAGNIDSIQATVSLARCHTTAIGSHPGHSDYEHFGRRALPISPDAAAELVVVQVGRIASVAGDDLRHVKLHGALYHQVGGNEALAVAVSRALAVEWPHLLLYAAAGSLLTAIAEKEGLCVIREAFTDRRYDESGELVSRTQDNAMIDNPNEAAAQAYEIVQRNVITTPSGKQIPISAETLCVHGDGPAPFEIIQAIRLLLKREGISITQPTHHSRNHCSKNQC